MFFCEIQIVHGGDGGPGNDTSIVLLEAPAVYHLHPICIALAYALRQKPSPQPDQNWAAAQERLMATKATRKKSSDPQLAASGLQHPLRIVPLHTAPRILSTTAPQLSYRQGPLLTSV